MSTAVLCVGMLGAWPACDRQQPLATAPQASPAATGTTAAVPPAAVPAPAATGANAPIVLAARVPASTDRSSSGTLEFISESFEQLYPWLLVRRSMPPGEKASRWHSRYNGRWARWSGAVMSVTANGLTIKQLATTTTYDVSLWLEGDAYKRSRDLRKGDRVTFVGRLDAYDDVLRHMLLTHGTLVENTEVGPPAPLPSIPPEALQPPPGIRGGGPSLAPPSP